jgi:hypothetical protein
MKCNDCKFIKDCPCHIKNKNKYSFKLGNLSGVLRSSKGVSACNKLQQLNQKP